MTTRRPKGWWKWYYTCLDTLASKAFEAAMVVSDGDRDHSNRVRNDVRIRHYWREAGRNAKGQDVFFCWTVRKDESGYFRTWREVHTMTEIKRYDVAYRKSKAAVAEIARKRYNAFIATVESEGGSLHANSPGEFEGTVVDVCALDRLLADWEDA